MIYDFCYHKYENTKQFINHKSKIINFKNENIEIRYTLFNKKQIIYYHQLAGLGIQPGLLYHPHAIHSP